MMKFILYIKMKAVTFLHCIYKLSFSPCGLFVVFIMFSTGVCFPCYVGLLSCAEIFRSVAAYITPFSVRNRYKASSNTTATVLYSPLCSSCFVAVSLLAAGDKMPDCQSV